SCLYQLPRPLGPCPCPWPSRNPCLSLRSQSSPSRHTTASVNSFKLFLHKYAHFGKSQNSSSSPCLSQAPSAPPLLRPSAPSPSALSQSLLSTPLPTDPISPLLLCPPFHSLVPITNLL